MVTRTRRPLAYTGQRAVSAPATWGQRGMWFEAQKMGRQATVYNLSRTVPVPSPLGMDTVLAGIAELLGRYEVLRTLFRVGEDGRLHQHVLGDGKLDVEIWSADTEAEALELEREAAGLASEILFDHAGEPPVHAVVVALGEAPRAVCLTLSHLALDATGGVIVRDALAAWLEAVAAGDAPPEAPPARQPVEQALFEQSPEGQRFNARALAYQADRLAVHPRTMFPIDPGPPAEPRFWRALLNSRAAAMALNTLGIRHSASTSTVLLAAVSALLGRLTGMDRVGIDLIARNRFAATRLSAANLVLDTLFVADVGGTTFDRLVRRTWSASTRAYLHGLYDRGAGLGQMEASLTAGRSRGCGEVDVACFFNDVRRQVEPPALDPAADAATIRKAMSSTSFEWHLRYDKDNLKFFVSVFGDSATLRLGLGTDTRYVPPPLIRDYLFGVERLLVELAAGEDLAAALESTGIDPPSRQGRWMLIDHCWVSPEAVERLLSQVAPGVVVRAVAARTGDGDRVTAYLAGTAMPLAEIHESCLRSAKEFLAAIAPHRYVLCETAPGDPADDAAWAAQPVLDRYTSRPDTPVGGRLEHASR